MVLFNYSTKELTAKIVYYGPGLCGKTTNLQYIHANLPGTVKGKMLSLATKTDRTLFFDFLPIDLGEIRGMQTRVQLYTVPGQVFYNETRKLVLKGADGIVFVADSQQQMLRANAESFKNLEDNLRAHGIELGQMPHVIQFNKRDLPKLASLDEMNTTINKFNAPFYESVATTGIGVQDTLKAITKLVLLHLTKKYDPRAAGTRPQAAAVATPAPSVAPARPAAAPAAPGTSIPLAARPADPGAATMRIPVEGLPLAAPKVATPHLPPAIDLAADDLDTMIGEVEEPAQAAAPEIHVETVTRPYADDEDVVSIGEPADDDRGFEIDHAADPEWDRPTSASPGAAASSGSAASTGAIAPTVTLIEVATDNDLFTDPGLEVARLQAGDEREILVPVELNDPSVGVRRFKLSVRLRLDSAG